LQDIRHAAVAIKETDAVDAPVTATGGDVVVVEGHVSAVEAADADVEDARDERRAVVLWYGYAASANRAEV
jgi:hypothetical protein